MLVALEADDVDETVLDLGKKLAMHVAAANPLAVSRAELAPDALDRERAMLIEQARGQGKPEQVMQKMVEGRLGEVLRGGLPARAGVRHGPADQDRRRAGSGGAGSRHRLQVRRLSAMLRARAWKAQDESAAA